MAKHYRSGAHPSQPRDDAMRVLLDRYVRAWETADIDSLIALLKEDAIFPMPPSPSWYQGKPAIRAFVSGSILAGDAAGRWRLVPTRANSRPALAWYKQDETTCEYHSFGIQVLAIDGELVSDLTMFANPAFLRFFGFPGVLKAGAA